MEKISGEAVSQAVPDGSLQLSDQAHADSWSDDTRPVMPSSVRWDTPNPAGVVNMCCTWLRVTCKKCGGAPFYGWFEHPYVGVMELNWLS